MTLALVPGQCCTISQSPFTVVSDNRNKLEPAAIKSGAADHSSGEIQSPAGSTKIRLQLPLFITPKGAAKRQTLDLAKVTSKIDAILSPIEKKAAQESKAKGAARYSWKTWKSNIFDKIDQTGALGVRALASAGTKRKGSINLSMRCQT